MKIGKSVDLICITAFLFFSIVVSVSAQNNGSFEVGTNPGGFTTVSAGQTNVADWSVDFGSVDYIGSYWQASSGVRSIDLNGQNQRGQIGQTLTTTPGWSYQVTFDMSGNPDGGPTQKFMSVTADKINPSFYVYAIGSNTRPDMQYAANSYAFTAGYSTTLLNFTSLIFGFYGPVIDNVNVSVITQVCHLMPDNITLKTLTLTEPEVAAHLAHGDEAGPCSEGKP